MIVERLTLEIVRMKPDHDAQGATLEDEAENIRDCLLDATGYPLNCDFRVRVLTLQELPQSEAWEINHG